MLSNCNELAHTFNKDRHTIKTHMTERRKQLERKKSSELDPYFSKMIEVLSHPGTKIKPNPFI